MLMRKTPEIVESHNVISVRMSEHHRIQTPNVFAKGLGSKICSRINNPGAFRSFNVDG